ncbi:MAG TPA: type II secretion system F family protein [Firmicutes bacterium]|nr:type II secretion system F family protein [Candidatus Fermentithermobacillaceae bacterium]
MSSVELLQKLIPALAFSAAFSFAYSVRLLVAGKRIKVVERLHSLSANESKQDDDIMARPFFERTIGALLKSLVSAIGQTTPGRLLTVVEERLMRAGNPRNMKAGDYIARIGIAVPLAGVLSWFLLRSLGFGSARAVASSAVFGVLGGYLPWMSLGMKAANRKKAIQKSLPDIMDLLVVSVEAGLAFDMALMRVVERFKGTVAEEFQRVLKEMQLGKSRKDALKDMANRVDLHELTALVTAIIQADQLGVSISGVLRMQGDLIREKRQQFIEEQAMKAPVKMLFPLIVFIFPSIFVIVLGPALINILKVLAGM